MEYANPNRSGVLDGAPLAPPDQQRLEHCHLFLFVVDTILTGSLCLCGFAGNTISFMTLWQDRLSVTTFLLQATIICDLAVLWMIFLADCVPGLRWALHILDDCRRICGYVSSATRPLLFLAQTCAVWLTLLVLANRCLVMSRHHQTAPCTSLGVARKYVIATVLVATAVALPLTVEEHVHVADNRTAGARPLRSVGWYQLLYHDVVGLLLVYAIPLLLQLVLIVRLAFVVHSVNRLRSSLATSFRLHDVDMTQVVLTLSVTMVICYTPVVTEKALLWIHGHPTVRCSALLYYLHSFSKLFVALNSSMKIVLLSLFDGGFKLRLGEVLSCSIGKKTDDDPVPECSMYQCPDMSEMTLISNVDSRT